MKTRKSTQSGKPNRKSAAIINRLKARRQINSKAEKSKSTKRVSTKGSYWTAKEH